MRPPATNSLQAIGMLLDAIADAVHVGDMDSLKCHIDTCLDGINEEMTKLRQAKAIAEDIAEECRSFENPPLLNEVFIETLPIWHILSFSVADLFGGESRRVEDDDAWELLCRRLKQRIKGMGLPLSVFKNVCGITSAEAVRSGEGGYSHAFLSIEGLFEPYPEGTSFLPAGQYLSIYVKTLDESAFDLMDRLVTYAVAKGLDLCGYLVSEMLFRFPHYICDDRRMLGRVCAPLAQASPTRAPSVFTLP